MTVSTWPLTATYLMCHFSVSLQIIIIIIVIITITIANPKPFSYKESVVPTC